MNSYVNRVIDNELDDLCSALPAISLEGPKAVGKTESALRRARTIHRLDDPAQRAIAQANPAQLVSGQHPVLIDEWQRVPECWDVVRRAVDEDGSPNRFLLTGSATPSEKPTHSGAARIVTVRMRPLTLAERLPDLVSVSTKKLLEGGRPAVRGRTNLSLEDYAEEILRSGFPGLRDLSGRPLRAQLDSYLDRIVDSEFVELGHVVRRPHALKRWMAAYAAATATTATYETIRDAATPGEGDKPARTTTIPYQSTLEQLWIVEPLPAWLPTRSHISRLTQPPKHHLADPALAARLLGIGKDVLLQGRDAGPTIPRDGTLLGHLFESLVTLCVRVYAQGAEANVGHLRTKGGRHEVDLIVERADHRVLAIEVKLSRTISDDHVKHLHWLQKQIGDDLLDAIVINTGPQAYRRKDGIAVVPAALLGP